MRSLVLRVAALAGLLLVVAPASASAALRATDVRIGAQPGFARVVVDFTGATLQINDAEATDPGPADGKARVEIRRGGIVMPSFDLRGEGFRVRTSRPSAGVGAVLLTSEPGRFKYLRVSVLHGPERLVLDLYRRTPPSDAAEIRSAPGGCLTLTSVVRVGRTFRVRGTELNLFEGSFLLRVRSERGSVVGQKIVTARGAWHRTVTYTGVPRGQAGTLEAVALSARDGTLACLVQVRVRLEP